MNAVAPGRTNTGLPGDSREPGRAARLAPAIPLGRAGEPDEIAAAIGWRLSDEARYATDAIVPVGGGF